MASNLLTGGKNHTYPHILKKAQNEKKKSKHQNYFLHFFAINLQKYQTANKVLILCVLEYLKYKLKRLVWLFAVLHNPFNNGL